MAFTPDKIDRSKPYPNTVELVKKISPDFVSLCETISLADADEARMFKKYDWDHVSGHRMHAKIIAEIAKIPSDHCHVLPYQIGVTDLFKKPTSAKPKAQNWKPADVTVELANAIARKTLYHDPILMDDKDRDEKLRARHGTICSWLSDNGYTQREHLLEIEGVTKKTKLCKDGWFLANNTMQSNILQNKNKTKTKTKQKHDAKRKNDTKRQQLIVQEFQQTWMNVEALEYLGRTLDEALSDKESNLVVVNVGMHSFYAGHACCMVFHRKYKGGLHRVYYFDSNNSTEMWPHKMFISGMHVTWYLNFLLDQLQKKGFLKDVQNEFLDHEDSQFVYWPKDFMIMIPSPWTPDGSLGLSNRRLQQMMEDPRKVPSDLNMYMNATGVREATQYLKENEGVCVPLTLLLNVALICFGEKALSNEWWSRLYVRVTQQTRVGRIGTSWVPVANEEVRSPVEIRNKKLASRLDEKQHFTARELDKLKAINLTPNSVITTPKGRRLRPMEGMEHSDYRYLTENGDGTHGPQIEMLEGAVFTASVDRKIVHYPLDGTKGDHLADALVTMFLRSFIYELYNMVNKTVSSDVSSTSIKFSRSSTLQKAFQGDLDPVTFNKRSPGLQYSSVASVTVA